MTANCLLKRFDLVADTPGNIPRLRKLIVDLAVRGKLLKKTSGDASPEELLRRIAAKRELLIKAGKLRKQKPLRPITSEELPAAYSAHSIFERLGNVAILEKGLTGIQSAKRGDYPLVVTAEARSTCDHFDFDGAAAIIPMVSSSGHGDASLKRLHYQQGKFALGNILCAAFPISSDLISARFLYEYLTAFKEELLVSKMIGTANVSLTMGKIGDVPVPIVAPSVQQRVEELMRLCDALEAAQREREAVRTRLRTSALYQLASPDSDSKSAAFVLDNLPRIACEPDDIANFRRLIRGLAIVGRLTSRAAGDVLAEKELRVVSQKKEALALRKVKPSAKIEQDECWCAIPTGWRWTRWDEVTDWITYGFTRPMPHVAVGVPIVTGKNVNYGTIDFDSADRTTEDAFAELSEKDRPVADDILLTKDGSIGRAAIVSADLRFCINQSVAVLWLRCCHFDRRFLLLAIECPQTQGALIAKTEGVAIKHISVVDFGRMTFPLPPLAEQRRIVAKVDELMAVLDALEAALITARTTAEKLLAATVAGLHAA